MQKVCTSFIYIKIEKVEFYNDEPSTLEGSKVLESPP